MSGLRKFAMRLVAGLVVAAAFLLLLEGGIRLLPLERWERDKPNLSVPLFISGEGEFAEKYVLNPHFLGAMSFQSFAKIKPPGVKRVFVLGGSAAFGWPGPNSSSFSGYMQRALEKAAPGKYEIVSVAAMSYGSHRVLNLLHDVVGFQPDVIIIWSGNNEYIERNVFSSFARSATMDSVQRVLRHSSTYRALRLVLQSTVPSLFVQPQGVDITNPRNVPMVRRGMMGRSSEMDRQVMEEYRNNLQSMARLIKESGAVGIFCTVPVNLSGWAPSNVHPEFIDAAQSAGWDVLQQHAFTLWDQRKYAEALPSLRQLVEMTPRYALGHYLLGTCYQSLGRIDEAKFEFNLARDLDPRPMRALTSFDRTIREIAAAQGVALVDLEKEIIDRSGTGISGEEFFLDYVHLTELGNKFAASLVLSELLRGTGSGLSGTVTERLIAEDDWFARNFNWDVDYYYTLGMTFQNNGDTGRAEEAYLLALQGDPAFPEAAANLGNIYEKRGDLQAARRLYEQAMRSDPDTVVIADLARLLYLQGDKDGALAVGQRVVSKGVVNIPLLILLGDIESEAGDNQAAISYYRQALDVGGEGHDLMMKLGNAFQREGDVVNAQAAFEQAKAIR